jgi:glycosyltransferase involved in cell wall biosynthesis
MKVTLCVPVWNGEAFVEETLESARSQTLTDVSILVSVDKSDDRSAEICSAFAARDARFEVVVQPERLGWVGNVNWLLRHVQSEYASILPHDDLIMPSYLERLTEELENRPEAVLAFCDLRTFGQEERLRIGPASTGDRFTRIVEFLYANTEAEAWRGVFRTEVLAQGCYHEAVSGPAADQAWLLRLAIEGSLVRVPQVLYSKRLHAESVVSKWVDDHAMPIDSHWADHCLSCHRIALAAGRWSEEQRQAIAAAVLMRAMRLRHATAFGSTPNEIAASLLALAADYALRLSDLSSVGSRLMTSTDLPDGLRAYLGARVQELRERR